MRTSQVGETFEAMLAEAGSESYPDGGLLWEAFKGLAAIVIDGVEPADDGFLFAWGTELRTEGERFCVSFDRQFSIADAGGEYSHIEHVGCTLGYAPAEALTTLGAGHEWYFRSEPHRRFDDWAVGVEGLAAFASTVAAGSRPLETWLGQERI